MPSSETILRTIIAISVLFGINTSCEKSVDEHDGKIRFVATIPPIAMILSEIAGGRAEIVPLLQPGQSPHTYDPSPSDAKKVRDSAGFFYVHPNLDGWAASMDSDHLVEISEFLPDRYRLNFEEHECWNDVTSTEEGIDPHFWLDPDAVRSIVPAMADRLSEFDPGGKYQYMENSLRFSGELEVLRTEVENKLRPFEGEEFILMHPSFLYLLDLAGFKLAGLIEDVPGAEPSAAEAVDLIKIIQEKNIKAIFSEPQLSAKPAETLAAETGIKVYMLDPNGGAEGRMTYSELIRYNADVIIEALSEN